MQLRATEFVYVASLALIQNHPESVPHLGFVSVRVYTYEVIHFNSIGVGGRSRMWVLAPVTVCVVGDSEVMLFSDNFIVGDWHLGIEELIML